MKKYFLTLIFELAMGCVAHNVYAQTTTDLSVTPVVIDEKAKARDILKETIMLKNTSNHKLSLYPSVNNINPKEGEQGFSVAEDSQALSNSLANWIELSRGVVELSPGEEKAVPFIIRLNLNAIPDTYHAQVSFTQGETRALADAHGALATVMVNVEVQADVKELLQLNTYKTDNVFFSGDDILFNYQLQNIGNQDLQPKGQIRIYDRKGQEIADVDVNHEGKVIAPDQVTQLASVWSAASAFGRYKALLTVDYGSSQTATVQDTVFFWVIPWKQALGMLIFTLVVIIILSLYFHNWLERRHLYTFAHAGLLNDDTLKKIDDEFEKPIIPAPALAQKKSEGPAQTHVAMPKWQQPHKEEHKSLRHVLQKEERVSMHADAINLKQLRAVAQTSHAPLKSEVVRKTEHTHTAEVHGHTITLKKHS